MRTLDDDTEDVPWMVATEGAEAEVRRLRDELERRQQTD
jgi:hypothetical protein